jgi:hypothetical protein
MNVYKKLQTVRNAFLSEPIKKSGKNKFAGYEYFELGDFIPTIHRLFDHSGLIGVVRFHKTDATLTIYNSDLPEEFVVFTTPMVFASNPKGQPIQDLGSTHTYLRRYLWLMALEIVEHDAVDASAPVETKAPPKVAPTPPKVDPTPPEAEVTTEVLLVSAQDLMKVRADQDLMIEKMIEHGLLCNTVKELSSLWKANQRQIDEIKATKAERFEKLKAAFAEMKFNLAE